MNTESTANFDFCIKCGTIMSLPCDMSNFIHCYNKECNYRLPITALHGTGKSSTIVFLKERICKSQDAAAGPIIQHQCKTCGHPRAFYITRQLRSADEGQTVFFTCIKCGFTDMEAS